MTDHKFRVGQTTCPAPVDAAREATCSKSCNAYRRRAATTNVALRAPSRTTEWRRKVNSSGQYDESGVRLQLTGRVVHSEAWGWRTAPSDQLSSVRHCSGGYPLRSRGVSCRQDLRCVDAGRRSTL